MQAGGPSWRRRCRRFAGQHLRQVPCLDAVVQALPSSLRFWRRRKYQTLGQEEGDGGDVEDLRQGPNETFGLAMVRIGLLALAGLTILNITRSSALDDPSTDWSKISRQEYRKLAFRRDAPMLLYVAALELVICGACAKTAAAMYSKRRHGKQHPQELPEAQRGQYLEVHLSKGTSGNAAQLYGLGFRPSTDGLECLLVEDVREGSLLQRWNASRGPATPAPAALAPGEGEEAAEPPEQRVLPGSAIVAVNDVSADVGLMQTELTKAAVTLWVRPEVFHASHLDEEILAERRPAAAAGAGEVPAQTLGAASEAAAAGASGDVEAAAAAAPGPRCASLAFEDEEPQILMRWLVCSLLFGWVTLLPVLLIQPNDDRPRQHLFRQFLLKPCLVVMPLWLLMWVLDCVQVVLEHKLMPPLAYFAFVHMLLPAVLVVYIMRLQDADEKLVLDQRKTRQAELEAAGEDRQPAALEDPSPSILRELLCVNPIAMVFLGAVAAIPIIVANLLTPLSTERSRMAQGFVNIMYAPLVFLQLASIYTIYWFGFWDLPQLYVTVFGLLFSLPCFAVWCLCLMCASKYGQKDMLMVEQQRTARAREALRQRGASEEAVAALPQEELVDLTEALQREFEYICAA